MDGLVILLTQFDWLQVSGRADPARPTPSCGFVGLDRFLPGTLSLSSRSSDRPRGCCPSSTSGDISGRHG